MFQVEVGLQLSLQYIVNLGLYINQYIFILIINTYHSYNFYFIQICFCALNGIRVPFLFYYNPNKTERNTKNNTAICFCKSSQCSLTQKAKTNLLQVISKPKLAGPV